MVFLKERTHVYHEVRSRKNVLQGYTENIRNIYTMKIQAGIFTKYCKESYSIICL